MQVMAVEERAWLNDRYVAKLEPLLWRDLASVIADPGAVRGLSLRLLLSSYVRNFSSLGWSLIGGGARIVPSVRKTSECPAKD